MNAQDKDKETQWALNIFAVTYSNLPLYGCDISMCGVIYSDP